SDLVRAGAPRVPRRPAGSVSAGAHRGPAPGRTQRRLRRSVPPLPHRVRVPAGRFDRRLAAGDCGLAAALSGRSAVDGAGVVTKMPPHVQSPPPGSLLRHRRGVALAIRGPMAIYFGLAVGYVAVLVKNHLTPEIITATDFTVFWGAWHQI